ncbi:M48 family metallopeptidase [Flavobacterium sp. NRK F7]|uniref:M48 family metallopeptidase n=1 Tax=Flavobacterium sp. NRK F7 TaxID=2954930 RepID=UPI0020910B3A|nr:SprT family zinc-dependent metalloprotease [Flavobacterium sp. NRK F7]MCO6163693.1 M48 family metallopeptidase [Flavobacterium sp. NRK F7]
METLNLSNLTIDIIRKDIKNMHLAVYPPNGRIRLSAPKNTDNEMMRLFAISKISWIKKHIKNFETQPRETPREFISGESYYLLGKRYLLKVIEHNEVPKVVLKHKTLELYVRPDTSSEKREAIIEEWYRNQLKALVPKLIEKWEKVIGVQSNAYGIKKMRTKWGTCNTTAKRIWLNLELAKKPIECIEFIIAHELVHLLERSHNDRFVSYMNEFMPKWRFYREELNNLPFRYVNWKY